MNRNTLMMIAIAALVVAALYLYRENQKLKGGVPVAAPTPAPKKVKFAQPVAAVADEKIDEKTAPVESE
jgi:hypothetical protein